MTGECENVELFLSGQLPDEDVLRFEAHAIECETCRAAVEEHRWIDGLLRSSVGLELESVPAGIATTVRQTMARRRKVRLVTCSLAGAAALMIAVGWIMMPHQQARDEAQSATGQAVIAKAEPTPAPSLQGREIVEPPRAVFDGGADMFVAAVESQYPNVTIVRLYPTYKPSFTSNASDESSGADEFNGG
jgi:hypothetical protein